MCWICGNRGTSPFTADDGTGTVSQPDGSYYAAAGGSASAEGAVLPTYSIAQISDQLRNGYWAFNGVSPREWAANNTNITVNLTGLEAARQDVARLSLSLWSEITGISFTETSGSAEMTFDDENSGAYASSTTSSGTIISSFINVNKFWYGSSSALDSYTTQTFIHEIGHALGLGHSGNYNGSATYGVDNHYVNDSWRQSIMSYFDQADAGQGTYRFVLTPQMADIHAIQQMYGVHAARATNTTYGFNVAGHNAATEQIYDFTSYVDAPAYTIYDTGGIDTLDASNYSDQQIIDLRPGKWSNIGGQINNIGIYLTSIIENAVGGTNNDRIYGNTANNRINGGTGADRMEGGLGNDAYTLDNAADVVVELAGAGTDVIYSSISFTLTSVMHVESLRASSVLATTALTLRGNGFDNIIHGNNGANTLAGRAGNDTLVGRDGADRFYFMDALIAANSDRILDFDRLEGDKVGLDNAGMTTLGAAGALDSTMLRFGTAAADANDHLIYDRPTGKLYYDADGNGAGAKVLLFTLNANTILVAADILVI